MRSRLVLLFISACLLSSCDKRAEEYAKQIRELLDERSKQISVKIAAERKAYEQYGLHSEKTARELVAADLVNLRNLRSEELAVDYAQGRKPDSPWKSRLLQYAQLDFEQNRAILGADMDSKSTYTSSLLELEIEQAKITALRKLLTQLEKPRSFAQEAKAIGEFGQEAKKEFDKLVCAGLKEQKAEKDKAKKESEAMLKALTAKGAPPAEILKVQDAIDLLSLEIKGLDERLKKCT